MSLSNERIIELKKMCNKFRIELISLFHDIQTGHTGGCFSVCEILVTIYMESANIGKENLTDENRDRIVLCKGHAAPVMYRCLCEKDIIPMEEMKSLRQLGSRLQGHPCSAKTPGVELTTGPLGTGLSASIGMACANKLSGITSYVFAVMGDGELNEGTVWEAAMTAAKYECENLIAVVDWNKVQLDGPTDEIMPIGELNSKWNSFGWNVIECDGHNIGEIFNSIEKAKKIINKKPTVILANTIKGKGVSFMEGSNLYHGKAINNDEYMRAMQELEVNV